MNPLPSALMLAPTPGRGKGLQTIPRTDEALNDAERATRACTNCVRAKSKCSPSVKAPEKCQRCYHMKKICQPSPPMRKRRTAVRHPAAKVGKLEEKLDGLVALLKSSAAGAPTASLSTSVNAIVGECTGSSIDELRFEDNIRYGGLGANDGLTAGISADAGENATISHLTTAASPSSESTWSSAPAVVCQAPAPSPQDAERYLDKFRAIHVGFLPFIALSPSTTAHQLHQERPFLWLSIMTVASTESTQQIILSKRFRKLLGHEAFLEGTRSLDLLQALLVYAAWDRRYNLDKPIFTSLVQFAMTILYDLGLDKPPSNDQGILLEYDLKGTPTPARFSRSSTLEERRSLLGCFLLSSLPAFEKKGETLRWTAYCDECLLVLEQEKEFPSDELLIRLVQLRLITERVSHLCWPGAAEKGEPLRPSVMHYVQSLQAHLTVIRSTMPVELTSNKTLLLELHTTETCIHEVGFSQAPELFLGRLNQRFESLWACLQATKSWIEVFLSIPPAQYVGFPACMYTKMARCLIDLWRLSTCEHPEWDRALVRETLDVSQVLAQTQTTFAQVKQAAGLDREGSADQDFFSIMATRLLSVKASWDAHAVSATAELNESSVDDLGEFPTEFLDVWNWQLT